MVRRLSFSPSLTASGVPITGKNAAQLNGNLLDRKRRGTDCGLGGRVHPQIAWAKLRALRDGAAIARKKLCS